MEKADQEATKESKQVAHKFWQFYKEGLPALRAQADALAGMQHSGCNLQMDTYAEEEGNSLRGDLLIFWYVCVAWAWRPIYICV